MTRQGATHDDAQFEGGDIVRFTYRGDDVTGVVKFNTGIVPSGDCEGSRRYSVALPSGCNHNGYTTKYGPRLTKVGHEDDFDPKFTGTAEVDDIVAAFDDEDSDDGDDDADDTTATDTGTDDADDTTATDTGTDDADDTTATDTGTDDADDRHTRDVFRLSDGDTATFDVTGFDGRVDATVDDATTTRAPDPAIQETNRVTFTRHDTGESYTAVYVDGVSSTSGKSPYPLFKKVTRSDADDREDPDTFGYVAAVD